MNVTQRIDGRAIPVTNPILALLALIPVITLVCSAVAWVRYGMDLPLIDDWRAFANGTAASLAPGDLFHPANDTIYATGKLLDALALRFLGYNGVVYQFLTLVGCLGLLLFLQHRLLFRSLPKSAAAVGFLACIFMLQPYSYWGIQNLAYHQILPLMALMSSLALIDARRPSNGGLTAIIALLSIFGGFAYISGAIVALTSACAIFLISMRATPEAARRLRFGVGGFAIGALVTLPAQLWVILVVQAGHTHSEKIPWTMPWTPEFWAFLFGLIGRTVSAQALPPPVALGLTALLALGILGSAIVVLRPLLHEKRSFEALRPALIYLTLFCGIGAYTLVVAASRASDGALPGATLYNWFMRSGGRFHYFWITLLIPWVAAVGLKRISGTILPAALSAALVAYAGFVGVFNYPSFYKVWSVWRQADLNCIQEKLLAGVPLLCGAGWPSDFTDAVRYARAHDVSFARNLLFRDEITGDEGGVFGNENDLGSAALVSFEGGRAEDAAGRIQMTSAGVDPQFGLRLGGAAADTLRGCQVIRLKGTVMAKEDDIIQVFVTTPDMPSFNEEHSKALPYKGGTAQPFNLALGNERGFLPDIRIDPGKSEQAYTVADLHITCR